MLANTQFLALLAEFASANPMLKQKVGIRGLIDTLMYDNERLREQVARYRKIVEDKPDIPKLTAAVGKELSGIDSVESVHCAFDETQTLDIVVLYGRGQRVDVIRSVIRNIRAVKDEFPDVDFRPVVLNSNQTSPDTLTGTHCAFQRGRL